MGKYLSSTGNGRIEMPTENLVSNENLLTLTSVLEDAHLPLTEERIDRIALGA